MQQNDAANAGERMALKIVLAMLCANQEKFQPESVKAVADALSSADPGDPDYGSANGGVFRSSLAAYLDDIATLTHAVRAALSTGGSAGPQET